MIIDTKDNTSIITQEKATASEINKKLEAMYPKFKNTNIIIHLTTLESIKVEDVNEFIAISKSHKKNNLSFVVVAHHTDFNSISDEIVAVPTLNEAFDVIEMEDIERDLGF